MLANLLTKNSTQSVKGLLVCCYNLVLKFRPAQAQAQRETSLWHDTPRAMFRWLPLLKFQNGINQSILFSRRPHHYGFGSSYSDGSMIPHSNYSAQWNSE